jgi:hypothetical protein
MLVATTAQPATASERPVSEMDFGVTAEACTAGFAVGSEAHDGNTIGAQTVDFSKYTGQRFVSLTTNEESGITRLEGLNDRGVAYTAQALHAASQDNPLGGAWTYFDKNELYSFEWIGAPATFWVKGREALERANSAREAIDHLVALAEKGDIKHGVIGPLRNTWWAHGNNVHSPELQPHELHPGGVERERRMEALLQERHYAGGSRKFRIGAPFFFEALRENRDGIRRGLAGDDDNISNTGYLIRTILGVVMEISTSHPEMLSIRFESPNSPLFSPHVPFFIGQGSIPPSWQAGTTNQTLVFQELMNAVLYNLDMADEVRSFWESFDDETAREVYGFVLPKAKSLLKDGDREAARELLYRYSNQRCEAAVTYAQQLIEAVKKASVIRANTEPFSVDALMK